MDIHDPKFSIFLNHTSISLYLNSLAVTDIDRHIVTLWCN